MTGIYKITSPSGKIYIGQSVNIYKRKYFYKNLNCKKQTKIYYSIKKYGFNNHSFDIIEECHIDSLNERERYWQDYYDVIGENGLNCRLTMSNDKSGKLSIETIEKIKTNRKGIKSKFKNEALRNLKISTSLTGKKLSQEHRKSLSISHIGFKVSEATKKKLSKINKGRKFCDKFKEKARLNQLGELNSSAKLTLNIETGIYYSTAKEAADSLGWSPSRMGHYLKGRTVRKIPFIYI